MVILWKHDIAPRLTVNLSPLNKSIVGKYVCRKHPLSWPMAYLVILGKLLLTLGMYTTAFRYVSTIVISPPSLRRLDDGDTQEHYKLFSLREIATIVTSLPFCLILYERSDAWMTLCFRREVRGALVAHHPIPFCNGPLWFRFQPQQISIRPAIS